MPNESLIEIAFNRDFKGPRKRYDQIIHDITLLLLTAEQCALDKAVCSGQISVLWTDQCALDRAVCSGQSSVLWTDQYALDRSVCSGQSSVLWTEQCALDRAVCSGQISVLWAEPCALDRAVCSGESSVPWTGGTGRAWHPRGQWRVKLAYAFRSGQSRAKPMSKTVVNALSMWLTMSSQWQANDKNSSECPEHVANNVKPMTKTVVNALSRWLTMSSQCQKQ